MPDDKNTLPITYEMLLEQMSMPALIVDTRLRVVFANQQVTDLVAQPLDRIINHPISRHFALLLPHFSIEKLPINKTIQINTRQIQLEIKPLAESDTDSNSKVLGFLVMMRDITPDYVTKNALRTYEQRYRALFERSNDAIIILDFDRHILIANERTSRMLHVELSTILQENLLDYIVPEDHDLFETSIAKLRRGEQLPLLELFMHNNQGYVFPVELSLSLIQDSNRQPMHMQVIMRDITARKHAERLLEERITHLDILLAAGEMVNKSLDMEHVLSVTIETARFLTESDAAFVALLENDKIVIRAVRGAYPESLVGEVVAHEWGVVGRALAQQEPQWILNVHSDPDYAPDIPETNALIALPLLSQGRLLGIINLETTDPSLYTDEIYQMAQIFAGQVANTIDNALLYDFVNHQLHELSTLYDDLHDAETLKTDMIRIANHDLKNPLAAISGIVQLMAMDLDTLPTIYHEYITEIQQALERANGILEDFLSVDAINQRMHAMDVSQVDLIRLVQRAIAEYKPQAKDRGLTFTFEVDEDRVYSVEGDEAQLYEAIVNLINNAIKYTPPDGHVIVSLSYTDDYRISFLVKDTGFGIPESRQKRLFEPFYRSQTAETTHIEGTGLGLHLVKNIIDRHSGEMIFESIYRQGSTFGFLLIPIIEQTPA